MILSERKHWATLAQNHMFMGNDNWRFLDPWLDYSKNSQDGQCDTLRVLGIEFVSLSKSPEVDIGPGRLTPRLKCGSSTSLSWFLIWAVRSASVAASMRSAAYQGAARLVSSRIRSSGIDAVGNGGPAGFQSPESRNIFTHPGPVLATARTEPRGSSVPRYRLGSPLPSRSTLRGA